MPRKHLVASQTNKKQQLQAKIWLKVAKEIKAAAKVGGPNPDANPRLKAAIDKALQNNLSRESIERNISGGQKDPSNMFTMEFECYGPNGLQIIVSALTDNQNRTASNLRGYLSKINGEIAKTNSVKSFFNRYGVIIILKDNNYSIDNIMESTMDFNVIDIIENEDHYQILTQPEDFYKVKDELTKNKFKLFESEIKLVAQSPLEIEDEKLNEKIDRFLNSCEDDDDIQWVITNLN